MPFAERFNPPLTTVRVPQYEIGTAAADLLLERLAEPGRAGAPDRARADARRARARPPRLDSRRRRPTSERGRGARVARGGTSSCLRGGQPRVREHPVQGAAAGRGLAAGAARVTPFVGRALRRREDERLVRGAGRFLDDIDLPDQVHVAFVRSPYARARITRVHSPCAVFTGLVPPRAPTPDPAGGGCRAGRRAAPAARRRRGPLRRPGGRRRAWPTRRALVADLAEQVEVDYDPLDRRSSTRASPPSG